MIYVTLKGDIRYFASINDPTEAGGLCLNTRSGETQQRITPELEESNTVEAQDRTKLSEPVGPIHHPELEPWLQNLVRRYFLDLRKEAPLTTPGKDRDITNSDDSLQTFSVSESDSPQS